MQRVAILGLLALAACSDALEQDTTAGQVVVVVERSPSAVVRLISAEDFSVRRIIPLPGIPSGQAASSGSVLLLSTGSDIVVFDFEQPNLMAGRVIAVTSTPGVARALAFQNPSVAWATFDQSSLGDPNRYLLARIDVATGETATRALPALPRSVGIADDQVFVLLAAADETSWLAVIDPATLDVVDSVSLTPVGGLALTPGDDGFLYVIAGGPPTSNAGKGRLSIVDPRTRAEVAVINGLGDPTGAAVQHPSGRLLVPSLQGILEVNTATRTVTRGPGAGVMPGGDSPVALVLDQRGRVYGIRDHCFDVDAHSGFVYVLSPPPAFALVRTIEVGTCPVGGAAVLTQ
jgi:hypothetical protein